MTLKGICVWFDAAKGYGFVRGEDNHEYFVHYSKIIAPQGEFRLLEENQQVEFEPVSVDHGGSTKLQAKNVVPTKN